MTIKKRGDKWIVTPEDSNRVLGRHDTKKEAKEQLRAIEASKSKRKKKK